MTTKDEVLKRALDDLESIREILKRHGANYSNIDNAIATIREALAHAPTEREQQSAERVEPVAVYVGETWCGSVVRLYEELPLETPLYTSPPASKPLTDEEIKRLKPISADFVSFRAGVRCMEREYGIGAKR